MSRFGIAPTLAILAYLVTSLPASIAQTNRYVDDDAPLGGDGLTWPTAHRYLQDALAASAAGDEIRVAGGTYTPDRDEAGHVTPGDREATFTLVNGVALRGGYRGCPGGDCTGDPNERDILAHRSLLSGDLAGDDSIAVQVEDLFGEPTRLENSYRVVRASYVDESTRLAGFTVMGGVSSGLYNEYGHPTITDCTFLRNSSDRGGGIRNSPNSGMTLKRCLFRENAAEFGGGMYNDKDTNVRLSQCRFTGNWAEAGGGGIRNQWNSVVALDQCMLLANSAEDGGGIFNNDTELTLTNCTMFGNTAELRGGGLTNILHGVAVITNSILWGNRVFGGLSETGQIASPGATVVASYSCIHDAAAGDGEVFPGSGNIDLFPLFVDAVGPDGVVGTGDEQLGLAPRSPCVDAGDNTAVRPDVDDIDDDGNVVEPMPLDLAMLARLYDDPCSLDLGEPDPVWPDLAIVDLGALEFQGDPPRDPDGDGLTGCQDNCPLHHNSDQADCDADGVGDVCAIALGASHDCQQEGEPGHGVPDSCDIAAGTSLDTDGNRIPDECQRVIHVDDDGPAGGNGESWETSFRYLQNALAASVVGDEIRAAGGTYKPDRDESGHVTPGDRAATFQLVSGVALRGGYRGCPGGDCLSGDPDERDLALYQSTLSGDLAGDDLEVPRPEYLLAEPTRAENSLHVVTGSGTDETTLLEGFTVTGGNANESFPDRSGGGMYNYSGDFTVANCTFSGNSAGRDGGGVYSLRDSHVNLTNCTFSVNFADLNGGGLFDFDDSNSTLTNCTFSGNVSMSGGGGLASIFSSPTLIGCNFLKNRAAAGGGVWSSVGSPMLKSCTFMANEADTGGAVWTAVNRNVLTNSLFLDNWASFAGGGIYSSWSDLTVTNCTFSGNWATNGRALACDSGPKGGLSTILMTDGVFWDGGNEVSNLDRSAITITHSVLQDGDPDDGLVYPGQGNIDDDPLFAPGPAGCYYLSQIAAGHTVDSPCVDTGSDTAFNLHLDTMTTRTDEGLDIGIADLGYHYPVTERPLIMGDFDRNGRLDLADVAALQLCFTGPGQEEVSPCCRIFDFGTPDSDVDEDDYAAFHDAMNEP